MQKFDTNVQELKFKVLKRVAKSAIAGNLLEDYNDIAKEIVPGPKPTMRCCIYKERAIVLERIKLALGGNKDNPNIVEVLPIACDECPTGGYEVTNRCRGCIAHRCEKACFKKAIKFDSVTHSAYIDKSLCVNCGMCAKACQYSAIANIQRPCEQSCKVKAISMNDDFSAKIDNEKCIQCGNCVYQCPFGAIMDKSMIVDVINEIKKSENSSKYPVYAVIAPSIAAQFKTATIGQIITAIKKCGFKSVVEAALGADMVAYIEGNELVKTGKLTTSCCPTFVALINKYFPELKDNVSTTLSPMAMISRYIKKDHPEAKIVFIGPCISKKMEIRKDEVKPYVDYVLTFEELNALIAAYDLDASTLPEGVLDNASYFGRCFARCGGVADAVKESFKEQNIDFDLKPLQVDGVANCIPALQKMKNGTADFNFLEGMGCVNGCIGGPGCVTHELKDKFEVDKYGKLAKEKTILDSISIFALDKESE